MSVRALGWLFTLGVLIHNTEEARGLPAWSQNAGRWHAPVAAGPFRFAVTVLSVALVFLAAAATIAPPQSTVAYLMAGYVLAMVLNVLFPHVLATVALRTYMPGTATALLFNLPLGLWYLWQAFTVNHLDARTFAWVGPATAVTMAAAIPLLFAVGRRYHPEGGEHEA